MTALIISPAFSFVIFKSSLSYLLALIDENNYNTFTDVTLYFCWIMWAAHVIIHNTHKFNRNLLTFLYFLSVLMAFCLVASLFHIVIIKKESLSSAIKLNEMSMELLQKILYLMYFTIVAPFICSILVDKGNLHGFALLLKTCIPFFISFYLMIPWFSSYAFSRCWDLTWGNRYIFNNIIYFLYLLYQYFDIHVISALSLSFSIPRVHF